MVAVAEVNALLDTGERGSRRTRSWSAGRLRSIAWWRGIVLVCTGAFFLVPLYAALRFSLENFSGGFTFSAFQAIPSQEGFTAALNLSIRLAVVTTLITLGLMVPTSVYVHLRLPRLRRVFDGITIVPIVIPPVVLIVGVLQVAPTFLKSTSYLLAFEYAILAMPFVYRSLDAGPARHRPAHAGRGIAFPGWSMGLHLVAGDRAQPADGAAFGDGADDRAGARGVHHGEFGPLPNSARVDLQLRAG
jgi:ABC-type Fe3+ transport system permease subunit